MIGTRRSIQARFFKTGYLGGLHVTGGWSEGKTHAQVHSDTRNVEQTVSWEGGFRSYGMLAAFEECRPGGVSHTDPYGCWKEFGFLPKETKHPLSPPFTDLGTIESRVCPVSTHT